MPGRRGDVGSGVAEADVVIGKAPSGGTAAEYVRVTSSLASAVLHARHDGFRWRLRPEGGDWKVTAARRRHEQQWMGVNST